MSPSDEQRRLLRALDKSEAVVVKVYRIVLVGLVVFVLGLLATILRHLPVGFGSQGEWFYLSIALLIFVAWVVSQFVGLSRRMRRIASGGASGPTTEARQTGTYGQAAGARESVSSAYSWSREIGVPAEDRLDDATLEQLDPLLTFGYDVDRLCRMANPRYAAWPEERQAAYRDYALAGIEAYRTRRKPDDSN